MAQTVQTYPFPEGAPRSGNFEVSVDGRPTAVYAHGPHAFASTEMRAPAAREATF